MTKHRYYIRKGVHYGTADDMIDYIDNLEAKLAKAVEGFNEIRQHCDNFGRGVPVIDERIIERCEETAANALKELKGEK